MSSSTIPVDHYKHSFRWWEGCAKWGRMLYKGNQLSGTVVHFRKHSLPSIPKCSQWI